MERIWNINEDYWIKIKKWTWIIYKEFLIKNKRRKGIIIIRKFRKRIGKRKIKNERKTTRRNKKIRRRNKKIKRRRRKIKRRKILKIYRKIKTNIIRKR